MEPIARFCDWLAQTAVSQAFQAVVWVVPTVQSVHIMAIGMLMAAAILLDLRLLRTGRRPIREAFASLSPVIWWALLALLTSGGMLIVAEPRRELLNPVFQAKMALLLVAMVVAAALQRWVRASAAAGATALPHPGVRGLAVLSLALWVAIIGCGRWIAYVDHG